MKAQVSYVLIIIFLSASGWAQQKTKGLSAPKCVEGQESAFYRHMAAQFMRYIYQVGVEGLPYTIAELQSLLKSTCIEVSEQPLLIDGEPKDAVNFYPEKKLIKLYKPTWDHFRALFQLQEWTIENYYQMFKIIHHEAIPYFKKRSDPHYEESLNLYSYLTPTGDMWDFNDWWLYTQKEVSPNFGHYMGNNCGITLHFNKYGQTNADRKKYENMHGLKDHTIKLVMGSQNPGSSVECPTILDVENSSPVEIGNVKGTWSFFLFCQTKRYSDDYLRGGEFAKYRPIICDSYKDDWANDLEIDKNLGARVRVRLYYLTNREIKITYSFHRKSWDESLFSFSNIYSPSKQILDQTKQYPAYNNPRLLKEFPDHAIVTDYPIQKWLYAIKYDTSEKNCAYAETAIKDYVSYECDNWIKQLSWLVSSRLPITTRFDDIIFASKKDVGKLYCVPDSYRSWRILTPKDNGCIVVGEKTIRKK